MVRRKIWITASLFIVLCLFGQTLLAQDKQKTDHSYKPLTVKLSEDGSKYMRFIMWHQIWATTNNLSVEDAKTTITPSIRRSRILAFAQVSPKFLILTHFGLNSLNPNNLTSLGSNGDAPQLFLHGAWAEFRVNPQLYIGSGLHYWKGLTRLSSASTLNFMTMDQPRPFVHWHSLGYTDQFARHLGIYAKGAIGKFDYRVAINQPGANPLAGGASYSELSNISYNGAYTPNKNGDPTGKTIIEGYFRYNLWDKESTKLPYAVGTYLGAKKVFALGAGFFAHPNGAYNNSTEEHVNISHLAVDAFLDMPVANGEGAINAYASFINFNYGDNYIGRWAGTGSVFYGQFGYFVKSAKIMPYVAIQSGNYHGHHDEAGNEANVSSINAGLNYYILGHNAKLTLEYHGINNDLNNGSDISQIRLQAHVFL